MKNKKDLVELGIEKLVGKFGLTNLLVSSIKPALSTIIGIVGGMAAGSIVLLFTGFDPVYVYYTIFAQAWGTSFGISKMSITMMPLLIIGVGLLFCFKAGTWNIGAQGQMILGALFANIAGYGLGPLPAPILIPIVLIASVVGGILWILPAAVMKAKWGINEVVTTMLFNFLAIFLLMYLVKSPLRYPQEYHPITQPIYHSAQLPMLPGIPIHTGLLIGLVLSIFTYIFFAKTTLGFQFRIIGSNIKAARYCGLHIPYLIFYSLTISGAICGLAGGVQLSGTMRFLDPDWVPWYGFQAVPLVFLARLNALALIPFSFFFASLLIGGDLMHRVVGLPVFFVDVIFGLMLILFAAAESIRYLRLKKRKER